MRRSHEVELELIGSIYDRALDPQLWSKTVEGIRRYLGLQLGVIGIIHLPGGGSIQATANVPSQYLRPMVETADSILELWGGSGVIQRVPMEEPIRMADYTSPSWWAGNPHYEEFCRPQGLADQLLVVLEYDPSMVATLSFGVHESMPPVDNEQIEAFRALAPHLRRAVLIGNVLRTTSIIASTLEATLDALTSAVLLVDAERRIVHSNAAARDMLKSGGSIAVVNGRLTLPHELAEGQFARTVAAASSREESVGPASGIPMRHPDGSGAIAHVLPLKRRAGWETTRAVAAVFVGEPDIAMNLPIEGMRALYDLRPAEVRVLQLVASGLSGPAVAEALGVSPSTVKTHTLRLYAKLGVHSRAGLVRLVRDLSLNA